MGDVLPLARPRPRSPWRRRPCACPDCRRCPRCAELIEALGVPQAKQCSFASGCPMSAVKTLDQVFKDFQTVDMRIPAPAPKKKV